jgi:peptide subunit release factor 1 (eRF1)
MQTSQLTDRVLRRLAETRVERGAVLTLYVDLDPARFADAGARASQVRSLLDDASRQARGRDGLTHEDRAQLDEDIERSRRFLGGDELDPSGARGLALFCAGAADLFEVVKLPRPVGAEAAIGPRPLIEPLVEMTSRGRWCVVLVNRKVGRILRGSSDSLAELESVRDDTHGQHDQGGWSQPRYQRSVEKEVTDHMRRTAEALFRSFERAPFDHLLVGGPQELSSTVEQSLHPYLRERLTGRFDVDVESSSPEAVLDAARPRMEDEERRRERLALDRLEEGAGTGGRGATGLDDVLGALNERRVETLLLAGGFVAAGVECPRCGWLGAEGVAACPVDGSELERLDDVAERAVELALSQSAEVVVPRHHDDLDSLGGVGAVLRF